MDHIGRLEVELALEMVHFGRTWTIGAVKEKGFQSLIVLGIY